MTDEDTPKIWIEQYNLNIGVRGGTQDSIEDVQEVFREEVADAVERDPKLGEDPDPEPGVQ